MVAPSVWTVALVVNYAAGADAARDYVLDSIQSIVERLFSIGTLYVIPAEFWETPFGRKVTK